ncbi:MAG: replication factor C small subunit [Candidatus Micrarchaeia archaeon]
MDLPWVEKYRPKTLSEVIGQKLIVDRLKYFVEKKSFPNMIFAGPAGIGKTTCALAMANDLYQGKISGAFKELNASDERGIDVIRGAVKEFAKTISLADIPTKIIFLDEADSLTSDAQHALRRTMEKFSAETRFILSANYASKIIDPIQSRCVVLHFKPLTKQDMIEYIERISKAENLQIDAKAIDALIYVSNGDMRRLTNTLQSCALENTKITEDSVYSIASRARPKEVLAMLTYAINGDFIHARDNLDELLIKYGMSAEDILRQVFAEVETIDLDNNKKLELIKSIGEYNFRISEGANERIQLESMLADFALLGKKNS